MRARGYVLPLALWLALLLGTAAVAAMRLAGAGAGVAQLEAGLARARAAAEGGAWDALHRLAALPAEARPPVLDLSLALGGGPVRVRAHDEDGRLDLNAAPAPLLAAVLEALGLDAVAAAQAAERVVAHRAAAPEGRGFATVGEVAALPGITPALAAALAEVATVHSARPRPAAEAAPPVLAALLPEAAAEEAWRRQALPGLRTPAAGPARSGRRMVWRVQAEARQGGVSGRVEAVVVLGARNGMPGRVLEWNAAPPAFPEGPAGGVAGR
jgi:general secretion pathway protein K